ncbi:VOC family protein [Dyadobacter sp. CY323]|uniref:VOC family protein n=1 Tax=Dyadobacter sp. CY323 TaxID=2907302 RepID=UPI001F166510|nr:VOC family protein [Dyadobacter sp. CY323]MCE6991929.1 VOC family protein [Dyadobacter sp. CY323]
MALQKITPNLWFADQAEEAAKFYTSIFKNSKITKTTYYSSVGQEIHGQEAGQVMTVEFELDGQTFVNLNGGPVFTFNEAISFIVDCKTQEEIDYYWEKLGEGGDPNAQQCGWLKDKYGVSWQVVPTMLEEMGSNPDDPGYQRAFAAMMEMKKMDLAALEKAYRGA